MTRGSGWKGRSTAWVLMLMVCGAAFTTGCASTRWSNLPPHQMVRAAGHHPDDAAAVRATAILRRLVTAAPMPVTQVALLTSDFVQARYGVAVSARNAGSTRCGLGDPPADGCVFVGRDFMAHLSDDALAGVIAHELGHIDLGHRDPLYSHVRAARGVAEIGRAICATPARSDAARIVQLIGCATAIGGAATGAGIAAHSRDMEYEADAAGIARLAAAGYCAGPTMRQTAIELVALGHAAGTGLFDTHPGWRARWERAGSECAPAYARLPSATRVATAKAPVAPRTAAVPRPAATPPPVALIAPRPYEPSSRLARTSPGAGGAAALAATWTPPVADRQEDGSCPAGMRWDDFLERCVRF